MNATEHSQNARLCIQHVFPSSMSGVISIQRMCSPQQTREGSGVSHWPIRGSTRANYFSKASGSTLYFESSLRFCWRGDSLGRRSSGKTGSRKAISSIRLSAHAVQHQLACNAPYNSQYMGRTTVRILLCRYDNLQNRALPLCPQEKCTEELPPVFANQFAD